VERSPRLIIYQRLSANTEQVQVNIEFLCICLLKKNLVVESENRLSEQTTTFPIPVEFQLETATARHGLVFLGKRPCGTTKSR